MKNKSNIASHRLIAAIIFIFMLILIPRAALATVGIMGAMDDEIAFIRKTMSVKKTAASAGRVFYIGKCQGQDVVLVKSEMGKVNAAITAQILVTQFKVDRVIFTGVAGGLDPALMPGDIVISTALVEHDYGIIAKNDFDPWSLDVPRQGGKTLKLSKFDADPALMELAVRAAGNSAFADIPYKSGGKEKRKPTIVKGIIATGDQFIASTKKREWLNTEFKASAVEMEGAAVAQVCTTYNVPFVVVRSLSDLADDVSHNTFMLMEKAAARNSSIIVNGMLKEMGGKSKKRRRGI